VVDQVIDEATDHFRARLRERDLVTEPERPILLHVLVGCAGDARALGGNALVEDIEQFRVEAAIRRRNPGLSSMVRNSWH
jgi:hypothetical protein